MPHLRSVRASHRHLLVAAQFGDLAPKSVSAAVKPTTVNGRLAQGNVVYTAPLIGLTASAGTVHWRSPTRLRRGKYWVQAAGVETDGVTDCPPRQRDCLTRYSNVVEVVVR